MRKSRPGLQPQRRLVLPDDRTQSGVTRREVEETSKKRFAGALRIEPAVRTEPLALVADAGNYGF